MNGFVLVKHELLRIHVEYLPILHFLDIFISRFVQAFETLSIESFCMYALPLPM